MAKEKTQTKLVTKTLDSVILRYVGFGLLFVGVVLMLYLVRGALPVFIVGGVLAYAVEPLLQRLEKRGRSRGGAVMFVFGLYVLLGLLLLVLLAAAVQQGQSLLTNVATHSAAPAKTVTKTTTQTRPVTPARPISGDVTATTTTTVVAPSSTKPLKPAYIRQITQLIQNNRYRLNDSPLPLAVKQPLNTTIDNNLERLGETVPRLAADIGTRLVAGTGSFLINIFLLTLVSFGLMLEAHRIKARMLMLIPPPYRRDITDLSISINELLGRYVRGQLIVCGTYGALCTVGFQVLHSVYDMQYPLVLGALAATIYILPYFGPALITLSAVSAAYLTSNAPVPCALAALGVCVGFNLIVDYGIAPRVLGKGVGLHPLMVVFALLCGYQLGGPLGTVVAVPIFASLRVIAIYLFPQLAAPLPEESPQTTSRNELHGVISETTKRVAEAEAKA